MANMKEYKCPCCGGGVTFDVASQKLKCPYCDTEFEIEEAEALEKEKASNVWNAEETEGLCVYTCNSCGGQIIGDETQASTKCPYCDSPVVMTGQFAGDLKPDYVIPFKLDKTAAKKAFKDHLSDKKLLPKAFKDDNHIEEIKGIYVPFWIFDADIDATVDYEATKVRAWSDSDFNYTEYKFYHVKREGNIAFERIPVDGSSKMADDLMESLEPFDFREAVDFQTAYLAGYLADRYDMDVDACRGNVEARLMRSTEEAFESTVHGYQIINRVNSRVDMSNVKYKYALYPVWTLTTKWKDQIYLFAMNGQTGKFVGNLPVDKAAARKMFFKWFGIIGGGLGAIAAAVMMLI